MCIDVTKRYSPPSIASPLSRTARASAEVRTAPKQRSFSGRRRGVPQAHLEVQVAAGAPLRRRLSSLEHITQQYSAMTTSSNELTPCNWRQDRPLIPETRGCGSGCTVARVQEAGTGGKRRGCQTSTPVHRPQNQPAVAPHASARGPYRPAVGGTAPTAQAGGSHHRRGSSWIPRTVRAQRPRRGSPIPTTRGARSSGCLS
jgi:hypothetical protein